MKSPELLADFKSSGAYSELIVELFREDGKGFSEFVNGLMPADLKKAVDQEIAAYKGDTISMQQRYGANLTPEELVARQREDARKRSEANMQGFQKKPEPQKPAFQTVPELTPVVTENAVIIPPAPVDDDMADLSREDLIARLQNR